MLLDTTVYLGRYRAAAVDRSSEPAGARTVAGRTRRRSPDTLAMATFVVQSSIWSARGACDLGNAACRWPVGSWGENDPLTLRLAGYLAVATTWVADVPTARSLALDTIERARSSLPADHPDLLRIAAYVTLALGWIGDPAATHRRINPRGSPPGVRPRPPGHSAGRHRGHLWPADHG